MSTFNYSTEEDWKPVDEKMRELGFTYDFQNAIYRFYKNMAVPGLSATIVSETDRLRVETMLRQEVDDFIFESEYKDYVRGLDALDKTVLHDPLDRTNMILDWIRSNTIPISLPDDLTAIDVIVYNARRILPSTLVDGIRIKITAGGVRDVSKCPKGIVSFEYLPLAYRAVSFTFAFWKEMPAKEITKDNLMSMYGKLVEWASEPGNPFRFAYQELKKKEEACRIQSN